VSEFSALAAKRFRHRLQSEQEHNAEAALSNLPFWHVVGPLLSSHGSMVCWLWFCLHLHRMRMHCFAKSTAALQAMWIGGIPYGERNSLVVNWTRKSSYMINQTA